MPFIELFQLIEVLHRKIDLLEKYQLIGTLVLAYKYLMYCQKSKNKHVVAVIIARKKHRTATVVQRNVW